MSAVPRELTKAAIRNRKERLPGAKPTNRGIIIRGIIAAVVFAIMGAVGYCMSRHTPGPAASVEDYLAWVGIAGAIALLGSGIANLMKSITDNDEWDVVPHAAKLFAALWGVIVSVVAAMN